MVSPETQQRARRLVRRAALSWFDAAACGVAAFAAVGGALTVAGTPVGVVLLVCALSGFAAAGALTWSRVAAFAAISRNASASDEDREALELTMGVLAEVTRTPRPWYLRYRHSMSAPNFGLADASAARLIYRLVLARAPSGAAWVRVAGSYVWAYEPDSEQLEVLTRLAFAPPVMNRLWDAHNVCPAMRGWADSLRETEDRYRRAVELLELYGRVGDEVAELIAGLAPTRDYWNMDRLVETAQLLVVEPEHATR